MSEPPRPDPLRRQPPVIDVTAEPPASRAAAETATEPDGPEDGASAVEPVAATGLGPEPFAPTAESPAEAAADADLAASLGRHEAAPAEAFRPVEATASAEAASTDASSRSESRAESGLRDAAAAPPPSRSGASWLAAPLAALIAAALASGATWWIDHGQESATADRLSGLERRVAALPTGNGAAGLEPRIAALEGAVRQAADEARAAKASAERAASATPGAAPPPDPAIRQDLDAATAKLDELGRQVAAVRQAADGLGSRLDGQDGRLRDGLATAAAAAAGLKSGQTALGTDIDTLKAGASATDSRLGEAERKLTATSETADRAAADLSRLQPGASQAGLRIAVASRLDDALRTGAPLGPATAALGRLGVEPSLLEPLKPYGERGAPSAGQLAAEFRPLADAMLTPASAPTSTWTERLLRVFGKVVTVRTIGDGSGTDTPALVGRIKAALDRGDTVAAAAAWDELPSGPRTASAEWGARLKARAAADAAARRIGTSALAGLDAVTR